MENWFYSSEFSEAHLFPNITTRTVLLLRLSSDQMLLSAHYGTI